MTYTLIHGEALAELAKLPPQSIDAIITDLPYGTTACKWDVIIPFVPMWAAVKRVLKPRGVFVTTASQPFTSMLVMSNLEWFKYEWAWDKNTNTCFVHVHHRPLGAHENILVFGEGTIAYNPQMEKGNPYYRGKLDNSGIETSPTKEGKIIIGKNESGDRYPKTVLRIDGNNRLNHDHPTQKPVALYEYLIRTYTNPGDVVLDFCMGSGTTIVAAEQTGRNSIGIEMLPVKPDDPDYFGIATRRAARAQASPPLFLELPQEVKQDAML
jgi:site-specific DNA-methyltransferase (adenine-specific)